MSNDSLPSKTGSIGDLEPCPFCGGQDNLRVCHDRELGHYVVECSPAYRKARCTAMGPWASARDEAIAAWNRRAARFGKPSGTARLFRRR
jgi:Lar family restriction alleviation protein